MRPSLASRARRREKVSVTPVAGLIAVAAAVGLVAWVGATGYPWQLLQDKEQPSAEDPLWVARQIARDSLEPSFGASGGMWRAHYRGALAYVRLPECCDMGGAVYDVRGNVLEGFGGIVGGGPPVDYDVGFTVLWKPSDWQPATAAAVLQSRRLRTSPSLLAYAQLESDTGVPWAASWPEPLSDCPPDYLRADGEPQIVTPQAAAPQAAMAFLTRYKKLLDLEDPTTQVEPDRDALPGSVAPGQTEVQLRRRDNRSGDRAQLRIVVDARSQVVEVSW
jgi:hypothetical protein